MIEMVAWSAIESCATPGPKNSINLPTMPICRKCCGGERRRQDKEKEKEEEGSERGGEKEKGAWKGRVDIKGRERRAS